MKKHTKETIIKKLRKIYEDFYDYSKVDYKSYNENITLICPKHGEFNKTPKMLSLGVGCPKCSRNMPSIKELINEFNLIHNNKFKYNVNEYKNNKQIIEIECPIHGKFKQSIKNHKKYGCKKCSRKYLDEKMFINSSNEIHDNFYDYSKIDFINNKTKVEIICPLHGKFKQKPNTHLMGHGCPICKQSKGELEIRKYLKEKNIKFEEQKKFKNCKNKRELPFDFYLPEFNICIEFDGKQHFEVIEKFGGEKEFEKVKLRDEIKNNYCKLNNIRLIRIKYNQNIEKKLNSIFKKKCRICNENKDLIDFHKKKDTKDGYRNECKECVKIISKKYVDKEKRRKYDKKRYHENKEVEKSRKKKFYYENQEKILKEKNEYRKTEKYKKSNKEWRKENKERLAINQSNYRKNNPHVIAWRSLLHRTLNQFETEKSKNTIDELGYSAEELKSHIESLFKEGMNWDNHGKWHIDHIKPVSKFDKNSSIKEVNALENLQPLWANENWKKYNK